MAVIPEKIVETVEEIMRIYKSLPARPAIEEVEAARTVVKSVDADEQAKLDEIARQRAPPEMPRELFAVLQEVRRNVVMLQSYEQRHEAARVVEVDRRFQIFDDLIQRASDVVSGDGDRTPRPASFSVEAVEKVGTGEGVAAVIGDESLVMRKVRKSESRTVESLERNGGGAKGLERSNSTKASFFSSGEYFWKIIRDGRVCIAVENGIGFGVLEILLCGLK